MENERGSVLVVLLLASLTMMGLGLALNTSTINAIRTRGSIDRHQRATLVAEAALAFGRKLLHDNPDDWGKFLDGTACSAEVQALEDPQAAKLGKWLCDPSRGGMAFDKIPLIPEGSATIDKIANRDPFSMRLRVRNDAGEFRRCDGVQDPGEPQDTGDCNGDSQPESEAWRNQHDEDGRIILRAAAVDQSGREISILEVQIYNANNGNNTNPYTAKCYWQRGGCDGTNTNTAKVALKN